MINTNIDLELESNRTGVFLMEIYRLYGMCGSISITLRFLIAKSRFGSLESA
jgi:hypothetical protein